MNGLVLSLHVGGSGSIVDSGPLTPPTVAPVLAGTVLPTGTDVMLEWTASNKTNSDGFGYKLYLDINSSGYTLLATLGFSTLSYLYSNSMASGETYSFKVVPFNDAGDGPDSNVYSTVLPAI